MKTKDVKIGEKYEARVVASETTEHWVPVLVHTHLFADHFIGKLLRTGAVIETTSAHLRPAPVAHTLVVRDATSFDGRSCNFCDDAEGGLKVVESRVSTSRISVRMCGKCVSAFRAQTE